MKITRSQLRKLTKESINNGDVAIEGLLKILRPLKSNEQSNHKIFVSLVPYVLAEYTPLGEHLGVVKLTETEPDKYYAHYGYGSDIKIEFKDDASLDNFVAILNSVGLERHLHFGSVKYKGERLRSMRNPYVRFSAVDYSEDIDDIAGPPLDEAKMESTVKITRRQLRRLILENDDGMIDYINSTIDDYKLNEDYLEVNHWNQLDQLIEDVFPGAKPPTLKVWEADHPLTGEIFESYVTQEEALTAHLRRDDIVPSDNEGNATARPMLLDWNSQGYAYIYKWE